nr:hypothetical protein [Ktedonobacteraceae bacterium]
MANLQTYKCPQCGQIDRVEKVSALVGAGTAAGLYTGNTSGSGVIAGISQTALSQKLSPPTKPTYQNPWGCVSSFITGMGIFIGTASLIGIISVLQQGFSAGRRIDSSDWVGIMQFLSVIFIPLIISVLIIVVKAKTAQQRKITFAIEYPRWQHAMINWNELYYCARNDVVFRPGKPQDCVPVSQMAKLL